MKSLDKAVRARGAGGHPMPSPFADLERLGIRFRKADVSLIAGLPNAGKSPLALWAAVTWVKDHGLKGLYFSADSPEIVQGARALAMVSHDLSVGEAEQAIEQGDEAAIERLYQRLKGLRWNFNPEITYQELDEEVSAFVEMWGCNPDFIIVDNLTDVDGHAEDEWGVMRRVMKGLTSLARHTGAHVMVLHHVNEGDKFEGPCPPRKAISGKVSAKPGLVLTVGEGDTRRKPVALVKHRYGNPEADKSGQSPIYLPLDYRRMHFA